MDNKFLFQVAHLSWQGGAILGLLFLGVFLSQLAERRIIKFLPRDLIFTVLGLLCPLLGIVSSKELYKAGVNQAILFALGLWILEKANFSIPLLKQLRSQADIPNKEGIAKLQFGAKSALFAQDSDSAQIAYSQSSLSIGAENKPVQKSSNLASKVSFATPSKKWRGPLVFLLFLGAVIVVCAKMPIGTTFFCMGLVILSVRPFSLKKAFCEEFPLPLLLEIFSAYIFLFATQNSGISQWVASLVKGWSTPILLFLFFVSAQALSYFIPRFLTFLMLFSVVLALFSIPVQVFLFGVCIAIATAISIFVKCTSQEIPFLIRIALIFVLFSTSFS